jgi:hypothetical protein
MTIAEKPESIFTLTIDAQEMNVSYWPDRISGLAPHAMIEFRSPHEPRRRIPVSETGYRSYFAPMHEIEAAPSVEEYVRAVAKALIAADSRRVVEAADQLPLF